MTSVVAELEAPEASRRAQPTVVLDKSVLQRIAELPGGRRREVWETIHSRFSLIVPNVLVEEVLVNWGDPGQTPISDVAAMVEDIMAMSPLWLADEIDWAYQELVLNNRGDFVPAPEEFVQRVRGFNPRSRAYQRFLADRRLEADEDLANRMVLQQEAGLNLDVNRVTDEHGRHFHLVSSEQEFFQRFIAPAMAIRDSRPELWFETLEGLFGERMRRRYPEARDEIDAALRRITSLQQLFECPGTFNIVVTRACYLWAPVVKIGTEPRTARMLLRRSEAAQRGNIHDFRYVATAMLCHALVTRDGEMARIASVFRQLGLWDGVVCRLPQGDIQEQIETLIL